MWLINVCDCCSLRIPSVSPTQRALKAYACASFLKCASRDVRTCVHERPTYEALSAPSGRREATRLTGYKRLYAAYGAQKLNHHL